MMFPRQHEYKVTRTARVHSIGRLNADTKQIWFVLHGYGQLAERFIKRFEPLAAKGCYVVAPEALSRFYVDKEHTKVGASWMTKEERENDIENYTHYLNEVYFQTVLANKLLMTDVKVLGFSQGTATASRWLAMDQAKIDHLILWGGGLAPEPDYKTAVNFTHRRISMVYSEEDPFYKPNFVTKQQQLLTEKGIKAQFETYSGGHDIDAEMLLKLV